MTLADDIIHKSYPPSMGLNMGTCEPEIVFTLTLNRKNMANTMISRLMELASGENGETLDI